MYRLSEGLKQIGILKVGDKLFCCNSNLLTEEKSVFSIDEIETDKVVEITTEDGVTISMSADQQLFVPKKWVRADQLSLGDILLKKDQTFIGIESIRHKNEQTTLRFIVVEDHHNFLVSTNGILIHNGVVGAAVGANIGFWGTTVAFNGFYAAVATGTSAVAGPVVGGAVGMTVRAACTPAQIAATKVATLWCGFWGAVLTGPV